MIKYNLQYFAKDGQGGEKTEPATAKKLNDARKEGQVAKSKEINSAFSLLGFFVLLKIAMGSIGSQFLGSFHTFYNSIPELINYSENSLDIKVFVQILNHTALIMGKILAPIFVVGFIISLGGDLVQVKWKPTSKPLQPKLNKFDPISGMKKIISARSLFELVKSFLKIILICYVSYSTLKSKQEIILRLYDIPLNLALTYIGDIILNLGIKISALYIMVGATMIFLGVVTPLNTLLFAALGLIFILSGFTMSKSIAIEAIEEEVDSGESVADEIRRPENVVSLLHVDPIELEFGYGIIPLADVNQGGDLLDRVVMIRRQIALELGTVVPIIRLRDNIQLNPNQYIIKIKGVQVSEGEILFDHYMAMNPGYVEEEITGIPTFEPSFHLPAIWITENQRERAESMGYTVVDPPSIIATHLTEVIRNHIDELLTRQDVSNLINNIKENNTTLIDELVPKQLGIGEIQKVLQNLLREGISIRDLLTICETLADYAATTRDPDILTEYARQSLKRSISAKYFEQGEATSVITLDPKIEQDIMGAVKQTEQGAFLTLDPEKTKTIIASVEEEVNKLQNLGKSAIIITSPIVRMYFKKLTQDYFKDLVVVSYNEIESNIELQSVGMVTI
ncbi:FHIPEP family type III secretion protein [Candidatus Galacturonibacter soehngenii]|uniref:Flagellar biosynthesis protein FlhA n=1 Tax=Candidatus Galacturonatibacter soehngenii TaxID=2307010 RepID=A0A7V7QJA5_9FIRM|nr:FHIPEP family type III secretion protein [Candidatus Galacturonibacter soehngenii]KAB1437692.1 hypothetical protein F7O84_08815 [Candidatus Galacturonibacter soehngenii]